MPRRNGNGKGCRDRNSIACFLSQADIKIRDFADNPAATLPSRLRKKGSTIKYDKMHLPDLTKNNQPQVSKLVMADEEPPDRGGGGGGGGGREEEDLDWDEKNLSDFEDDSFAHRHGDDPFNDEDDDERQSRRQQNKKGAKRKSKKSNQSLEEGIVYPADLWYMLARYIRPEEVGAFAGLCKDAYSVTQSVGFWRQLYHRHYDSSIKLPGTLQPSCVTRTKGLRAIVIQALYLMYEPYRLAITVPSAVGEGNSSPESVTNGTCLYTWSRGRLGAHYTHFLKMRDCDTEGSIQTRCPYRNPHVKANPYHRESILKVHCEHFQDVPSALIMGLHLVRASVSVSANMRHHRLKLAFGRLDRRGSCVKSSLVAFYLDPVLRVEVLHWWHPQFTECSQHSVDRAIADNVVNSRDQIVWEGL